MDAEKTHHGPWRVIIYYTAVACFFLQTGFVYFDYPRESPGPPLSQPARQGRTLWRANNCQACHQIYGFGGFLGPDLTNIVARRPHEDWSDILTEGRKQMPAFDFDEQQREAVIAFLSEVNQTGTGYPRYAQLRDDFKVDTMIRDYAQATGRAVDPAVLRGEDQIRENRCSICHRAFAVGNKGAPDISLAFSVRSPDYIREILTTSQGSMPAFDFLTPEQIDDMLACMKWMNENRRELGRFAVPPVQANFDWTSVPWFEY